MARYNNVAGASSNVSREVLPVRDTRIDLLKMIAILCVITIHVTSYGWALFPVSSPEWVVNAFWASLTRAAVPLFLMCSGVLMLDPAKNQPLKKLYGKNLLRIFVAMLVWAMAYKVVHLAYEGRCTGADLLHAAKQVLLFNQEFHLYYLHIMILVYICLPVTRLIIAAATKRQLEYCLAVWFAFGILYPTVIHFWPFYLIEGFPRQWMVNMTYAAIGYGMLGYYIRFYPAWRRGVYAALLAGGFAFAYGGTWILCARSGGFSDIFLGGMTFGVALMAAGIFGLCAAGQPAEPGAARQAAEPGAAKQAAEPGAAKQTVKQAAGHAETGRTTFVSRVSRPVRFISDASFCVYLVHVFFLYLCRHIGFTTELFSGLASVPAITAAIFLSSCGVYAILSRIPLVNKWLI